MKIVELKDKKFGRLKVIKLTGSSRSGSKVWECLCDCGNTCLITTRHLNRKKCNIRSCGCITKERIGENHPDWKGYKQISSIFWNAHINRNSKLGKRKYIEVSIDKKYAWDLFEYQNQKCALTGLKITFPSTWKDNTWTASLDRIDSSKGYIKDNVQWVHKHINIMKNMYTNDYFKEMCKLVATNENGACPVK